MKKIFYPILAAAAILTACNEEVITDGTGSLSFRIGEVADQYVTKADATVNTDDFFVSITDWNGNAVKSGDVTYTNIAYKDIPNEISGLPSGPYTVTVSSHTETPKAAFDTPVFGGSTTFNVKTGATTPVTVKCTVQNVKVTVNPSQNFLSELTTYTITVKNEDGGTIHWTNDENVTGTNATADLTLPAHFSVSALDVTVTGYRKISGAEVNLEEDARWDGKITDVKAADHHIINIDAQTTGAIGGENGENGITLIVDGEALNEVNKDVTVPGYEDVPVDGPDTGENEDNTGSGDEGEEPAVILSWPGNEDFKTMELDGNQSVELEIEAPNGIKSFTAKLVSDTPGFIDLVSNMTSNPYSETNPSPGYVILDFIEDPVTVQAMAEDPICLPTGEKLDGVSTPVTFALTTLVGWIPTMGGAGPDTNHTFTLTVVDELDNSQSWNLTFHVPASVSSEE